MFKKNTRFYIIASLLLMALLIVGCTQSETDSPDDQETIDHDEDTGTVEEETSETDEDEQEEGTVDIGEWSITIEVVGQDPVTFTNEDAEALGPVEITAAQKEQDEIGEEQVWTGILMTDLFEYAGVTDFSVFSVEASDGYSREFDQERFEEGTTGLGWMVDGELLDEESGPIQFIADQRGPNHWVKQVAKITIIE